MNERGEMPIDRIAEWLSRDPAGEAISPNLYDYVKNIPIDLVDRNGLCPCPDGQHLELDTNAFKKTVDEMTFDEMLTYSGFGTGIMFKVMQDAEAAAYCSKNVDPYFIGYDFAVDLGAGIGSLHCVPDGPPLPPPPGHWVTPPGSMPYQAGPDGAPLPGTPGSPEEPTPNNNPSNIPGHYVPAPPGAPPDPATGPTGE